MPEFLRDPKFWWAIYGLILAIVTYFFPGIPPAILAAVEALISVILTGLTIQSARVRAQERRALLNKYR